MKKGRKVNTKKSKSVKSHSDVKICHICGDDSGKHTPDCTSFIYGMTNGQNV